MISHGSHVKYTEMSIIICSHQLGKGQSVNAAMSPVFRPSQLVSRRPINRYRNVTPTPPPEGRVNYPSQECHKENTLPHQFTRGHKQDAAMPRGKRLSREGSVIRRRNAIILTPFPPVLGHIHDAAMPIDLRPILTRGHQQHAAMPMDRRLATKEIQYGYKI